MKQLDDGKADDPAERGVIYVGRIPHGFYEHQMRDYFSQFGRVTRLRLSRQRKTGASKHYAFIEFASDEVARIAAATMHNYLLFGHILKCRLLPRENVHEHLWKGADRRFKTVPRNRIEGRRLAMPAGKTQWKARQRKEEKRRAQKLERTRKIGYEFAAPALRSVDEVRKAVSGGDDDDDDDAVEMLVEDEKSLVTGGSGEADEGTATIIEEVKATKKKKKKKRKEEGTIGKDEADDVIATVAKSTKRALEDASSETAEKPAKKAKKKAKKAAA